MLICYHCNEPIVLDPKDYFNDVIRISLETLLEHESAKINSEITFHCSCFEEIAGREYLDTLMEYFKQKYKEGAVWCKDCRKMFFVENPYRNQLCRECEEKRYIESQKSKLHNPFGVPKFAPLSPDPIFKRLYDPIDSFDIFEIPIKIKDDKKE